MNAIRIVLADDHQIVRRGLRSLLERHQGIQVVGEAGDGREAVALAAELAPDLVIMDIAMPLLNGIEASAEIARRTPEIGIIILSMHFDESYLVRTLAAGAKGYLLKGSSEEDLVNAVRSVAQKKPFFSPTVAKALLDDYVRQLQQKGVEDSYDLLTPREKEILQLLAEGKTNKEAAALLNLSAYTVETHRTNLMRKLNLHNTAELVLYAVRKGVVGSGT